MNSEKTHKNSWPPEFHWPRIRWRHDFWLAFIPFILGFVLLFVPTLPLDPRLRVWRDVLGFLLCSAPVTLPVALWLFQVVLTLINRGIHYSNLYQLLQDEHEEYSLFRRNILSFLEQISTYREFEIIEAHIHQGKIYLVIRQQEGNIKEGDHLAVIHKDDYQIMGLFVVTDVHDTNCYAVAIGGVDPVWKGYLHERGKVAFFPRMCAIYVEEKFGNDRG